MQVIKVSWFPSESYKPDFIAVEFHAVSSTPTVCTFNNNSNVLELV
jgi:hypothetical protein